MSAARLTLAAAPDLEERLFELLAGIPASWTRRGETLAVWVEPPHLEAARGALAEAGLSFTEEIEEDRDWISEAAALQKAVVVGSYLFDPHDGARATPAEGRRRLHVPAERAFGTGSHQSTRLALKLLLYESLAGRRLLDVGCGAGTLAFVASSEGAAFSCAFDIDPDAAFATRTGLRRNAVARVGAFAGPLEALRADALFDVAVANMIAEELAPLLPGIARRLRPGGTLLTSGQLAERRSEWEETLRAHAFVPETTETEGEWIGFRARYLP